MRCIHCRNTPGKVYTHHVQDRSVCHYCKFDFGKRSGEVRYKGITQFDGLGLVHYYEHVAPLVCRGCGTHLTDCFYYCEDDCTIDLSQIKLSQTHQDKQP